MLSVSVSAFTVSKFIHYIGKVTHHIFLSLHLTYIVHLAYTAVLQRLQ